MKEYIRKALQWLMFSSSYESIVWRFFMVCVPFSLYIYGLFLYSGLTSNSLEIFSVVPILFFLYCMFIPFRLGFRVLKLTRMIVASENIFWSNNHKYLGVFQKSKSIITTVPFTECKNAFDSTDFKNAKQTEVSGFPMAILYENLKGHINTTIGVGSIFVLMILSNVVNMLFLVMLLVATYFRWFDDIQYVNIILPIVYIIIVCVYAKTMFEVIGLAGAFDGNLTENVDKSIFNKLFKNHKPQDKKPIDLPVTIKHYLW